MIQKIIQVWDYTRWYPLHRDLVDIVRAYVQPICDVHGKSTHLLPCLLCCSHVSITWPVNGQWTLVGGNPGTAYFVPQHAQDSSMLAEMDQYGSRNVKFLPDLQKYGLET